jgi:hypothetical protein
VVEFISALLHGVRRKNRPSNLKLMRVADAGLTSEKPAGKFEKLLRSDPELRFGWCRVCLLFENSIVCQVC